MCICKSINDGIVKWKNVGHTIKYIELTTTTQKYSNCIPINLAFLALFYLFFSHFVLSFISFLFFKQKKYFFVKKKHCNLETLISIIACSRCCRCRFYYDRFKSCNLFLVSNLRKDLKGITHSCSCCFYCFVFIFIIILYTLQRQRQRQLHRLPLKLPIQTLKHTLTLKHT